MRSLHQASSSLKGGKSQLIGFPLANTSNLLVTVIGGSGFIGRQVVRSLAKRGYRVRVASRRPDLSGHTQVAGVPGQVMPVQANVRFPASIAAACEGAYAVINATGTDVSRGSQTFDAVVRFGSETIAKAAAATGAKVLITVSGIGTDLDVTSLAVQAKKDAERAAATHFPGAMVVKPSVVFGPDDRFFNKTASLARFAPVLPLIGADTKIQPVYVGDVAEAVATLVDRGVADGKSYELGGPRVLNMRELMQFTLDTIQRKRVLLPLPWGVAKFMGSILGLMPSPILTADQVELLKVDNVVSATAKAHGLTLQGLGITPRAMETVVPEYLYRYRKSGQFTKANA
jgi:uncharacterized protein YbjT (DUF2867 family)